MTDALANRQELSALNRSGANFNDEEWRGILRRVIDGLKPHLPERHDG
jgi:hypothetical protein